MSLGAKDQVVSGVKKLFDNNNNINNNDNNSQQQDHNTNDIDQYINDNHHQNGDQNKADENTVQATEKPNDLSETSEEFVKALKIKYVLPIFKKNSILLSL